LAKEGFLKSELRFKPLCSPYALSELLYHSTLFGLYRDGTELRGVYYSKPEVAKAACLSLGNQCDYPILLGKFFSDSCLSYLVDVNSTHR